jgi:hypothetical protein
MMGQGRSVPGPRYDTLEPHLWGKIVPPSDGRSFWRKEADGFKKIVEASRNYVFGLMHQEPNNPRLRQHLATESFKALTYSYAALMEGMVESKQVPAAAKPHLQWIVDQFVPQVGKGNVKQTFEEEVREFSRKNINKFMDVLSDHGLLEMSPEQEIAFHHFMTTGETTYPRDPLRPDLDREEIPKQIQAAAGKTRHLTDQEFNRNRAAGMQVGYARSGWFPRVYDDDKIMAEPTQFKRDATALHRLIFDENVGAPGSDPTTLIEAFDNLDKNTRKGLSPDTLKAMRRMKRLAGDLGVLRSGLASSPDPDADRSKMAQIEAEMSQLAEDHHDTVREAYATDAADNWFARVNVGGPTDYDTKGPRSGFTKERVLPPEADRIMRNFLLTSPTRVIPDYFMSSARKTAYARRFGPDSADLEDRFKLAGDAGAHGADIRQMRRWVEELSGRNATKMAVGLSRLSNIVHAFGSAALMTRSPFTAASEVISAGLRTGDAGVAFKALGALFGEVFRTQSAKERAELADAIGLTTSPLYESALMTRTNGSYDNQPNLNRFMVAYYRRIGLTQLTNAQKRSGMVAGIVAIRSWLKQLDHPDPVKAGYARDELLGLGIDAEMFKPLAVWLDETGLPQTGQLNSPEGQQFSRALVRLTEQIVQDPLKVNKPAMASNPLGRMMFGLTTFNYAFQRNIFEPWEHRFGAAGRRRYEQQRGAGRGRASGRFRQGLTWASHMNKFLGTAALVFLGALLTSLPRQIMFAYDQWQEHMEKGDWAEWMLGLAWQRSSFNLTLDPLVNAMDGLRYNHDLSSLITGPQQAFFLDAIRNVVNRFTAPDVHTNTADHNAITGVYNLFAVPALVYMLSMAPGGPLTRAAATGALWFSGSRTAGAKVADVLVGPKGTHEADTGAAGSLPDYGGGGASTLPDYGGGGASTLPDYSGKGAPPPSGGFVPLGLADDIAQWAIRYGTPAWKLLPAPLKIAVGAGAGLFGVGKLAEEFGRFTGGKPPPEHPAQAP